MTNPELCQILRVTEEVRVPEGWYEHCGRARHPTLLHLGSSHGDKQCRGNRPSQHSFISP